MCCFVTALLLAGPRAGLVVWWLVSPGRFNLVYDTFVLPLLGVIFLPWTAIAYTLMWGPAGLSGLGWLLLILAFIIDIGSATGGAFGNRRRLRRARS
jgi:hypothetical protein